MKTRTHSEGKESSASRFPHRVPRKQAPSLADKIIPVHSMEVNRGYKGPRQGEGFDRWAFIKPKEMVYSPEKTMLLLARSH
jgi:hypothetical protein